MATIQDSYPLGTPSVANDAITIRLMLNEPTRINRYLSDLSLQNLFAADIFNTGGSVTGGALVYDQLTLNDLYLDAARSVQNVEPGAEFPIVTHTQGAPTVALVEKFGGKFFVTDEAVDRNDQISFQRKANKLLNDIVKGLNTRALTALDASITAFTATQTVTGVNWGTATTTAAGSKTAAGDPAFDFAKVQLAADVAELGYDIDTWIVHPNQANVLRVLYGSGNVTGVLGDNGIRNFIVSARVTAGTAYAVASGQVGELRFEKGISTETWREQATQRTWVQSDVRPVMAVTDPYACYKVTGLAG
jgi:hypothetical protein